MTPKEFLKKVGLASLGAAVVTKRKLAQVTHQLVQEGMKNKAEVGRLERKLKQLSRKVRAKASANANALVGQVVKKAGLPTRKEFNVLKQRLARLEKRAVIAK